MPLLAIPTFAIQVQRRSIEEETLVACFGEEYQQYAQRTVVFSPDLGDIINSSTGCDHGGELWTNHQPSKFKD
jgi:hypothetical protein